LECANPTLEQIARHWCRMDLPGPTTSVGTRTDYSVGPWDYPSCAARHLMARGARDTVEAQPLSGPASGLVITSTPAGRFVYLPDCKPADVTEGNSRCVAYLDSLPFQEGTPLAPAEEHTPKEVATSDSSLGSPDRQVFMTTNETPGPSGTQPDRYLEDISANKLSANAPADETDANKNAQRERNRRRNERR
jgi:hypothetical protein